MTPELLLAFVVLGVCLGYLVLRPNRRKRFGRGMREHIWIRDRKKCRYCQKSLPTMRGIHIDHVAPLSKGGSNDEDNLVLTCSRCNLKKGGRTPAQARMSNPYGPRVSPVLVVAVVGIALYLWTP